MVSHKIKRLAWFLPALLGSVLLIYFLFLLPRLTKAQSSVEFTVSPTEQTILPGSTAYFAITLTNTGAISLTNITVESEAVRPVEADFLRYCLQSPITGLTLDVGESYSYNCSEPLLYLDVQQTLLLSAETTDGNSTVSDSAEVIVHVEHLSANFDTEYQAVSYGDSAYLTLDITNSGSYDLTDISITPRDAAFADCLRTAGELPDLSGGQTTTLNCESPNIFEDAEVIFDVAATLDGSTAVSEVAYFFLDSIKGLELEISPDVQMIPANTSADLTLTLYNPDDVPITNLAVNSPDFPACNREAGSLPNLAGGQSTQYQCQTPELAADGTYTLTAAATSNNLAATAVANTTINANSQVDIEVAPNYLIIAENTPVTFTITVTNNLTDTLTSVAVNATSSSASRPSGTITDCARSLADLAPDAVVTYSCQGTAVPGEPYQSFVLSGFTPSDLEDSDANYHLAQADAYVGLAHTYLPIAMNNYQRPYTLPDLIIDNLTVSQISNNNYSINITVKNQSTLPVAIGNNFFVNAYLTSNLNNPIFVCSLQGQWFGAGQSYTCSSQITLSTGSHVIRAWADPYNTVSEEYETNNTGDFEVTND
jgi:hypothetical protein